MDKKIGVFLAKVMTGTAIISVYAGASMFFMDSFYYGSSIGKMNIGGYTVQGAEIAVEQRGENTSLSLYGRGVEKQLIQGKDIELKYTIKEDLEDLKKSQTAFFWPIALVKKSELPVTQSITYNKEKLYNVVDKLSYFQKENIVAPENASVLFNGNEYVIVPESQGKMLNREATVEAIIEALSKGETVLDLDEAACYEQPKITEDSPEILTAKRLINESLYTEITYLFWETEEKVTPQMLSDWLVVSDDQEVTVDEKQVSDYIKGLAEKYNTYGEKRKFKTSRGQTVTVTGGDFGWSINQSAEKKALIAAIKSGERINREPIANTSGAKSYINKELGNSYVEISLTDQYLWFYKNGKLVVEGSVVTGDKSRNYETPQGTYKLDYKKKNAILRGPGYATPVSYWMPFNGGIGIHDAVWRGSFGGKIYINNGSHGCVNAPFSMAKTIYEQIDQSMPIICYYS